MCVYPFTCTHGGVRVCMYLLECIYAWIGIRQSEFVCPCVSFMCLGLRVCLCELVCINVSVHVCVCVQYERMPKFV